MKFLAIIMIVAGASLSGPIAHFVVNHRFELDALWFFLISHLLAAGITYVAFVQARHDPGFSMTRVMVVLGYLAGLGCGVAFVVS